MIIFSEDSIWNGKKFFCEYNNSKLFTDLSPVTQVQAICVERNGKFVIYEDINGDYGLPGGSIEKGESLIETLERELFEEASIKPLLIKPLLYLKFTHLSEHKRPVTYQVRYAVLVDLLPYKISDPAGKAIKRHLVSENELIEMLNWGKKLKIYLAEYHKLEKELRNASNNQY